MAGKTPNVLLIAANPTGVSSMAARLSNLACEIHYVSSCMEAVAFVTNQQFDLVLCEFRLRDGSSCPLAASLIGSRTSLFYSYPTEANCWWLPAVKNGQSCWGFPAMRAGEFLSFLDDFLTQLRSPQTVLSDEFSGQLFNAGTDQIVEETIPSQRTEKTSIRVKTDAA